MSDNATEHAIEIPAGMVTITISSGGRNLQSFLVPENCRMVFFRSRPFEHGQRIIQWEWEE